MHVPCAPVQCSFDRNDLVAIAIPHQARVIHFGRIDDALGREEIGWIEILLDLLKGVIDARSKLPFNPFAAA